MTTDNFELQSVATTLAACCYNLLLLHASTRACLHLHGHLRATRQPLSTGPVFEQLLRQYSFVIAHPSISSISAPSS